MSDVRLRLVAAPALTAAAFAVLAALAGPAAAAAPAPGSDQATAQAAQSVSQNEAGLAAQDAGQTAGRTTGAAPHADAARLADVHGVGLLGLGSAGTRSLPEPAVRQRGLPGRIVRPYGVPLYALPLHARPDGASAVVGRLDRGDRFTTRQSSGGWTFIHDRTSRAEGWVHFAHPHHTAPAGRLPLRLPDAAPGHD
ncbi:SH3 domain-containing protein [Streptacidiphilus sp. PB12-B1b]|uniref:SH3 domain-containing protein n=1 Tax=Streptacidiphilus sp. PB12-B1b TaxID=2705012 RepID=UPI0015F9F575|nr:SH3 domain-containing protein [Streptacidiphilus sp. PB12-B1b]QMU75276.1 SH3 domain-containing protein [Streptacidiphilus sp. PB12-B1b]